MASPTRPRAKRGVPVAAGVARDSPPDSLAAPDSPPAADSPALDSAPQPPPKPRLTRPMPKPSVHEAEPGPNYALRLTAALEAIASAQNGAAYPPERPEAAGTSFAEVLEEISSDHDNRPSRRGMGHVQPATDSAAGPAAISSLHANPLAATVAISRPAATTGTRNPERIPPDSERVAPNPEHVTRDIDRTARGSEPLAGDSGPLAGDAERAARGSERMAGDPERLAPDLEADGPTDGFLARVLASLDSLPPIRLPLGPPIPWRVAIPVLLVLLAATALVNRPSSSPSLDAPTTLPAAPTSTVQPLFANPEPAPVDVSSPSQPATEAAATPQPPALPAAAPQRLGVQDQAGTTFDIFDIGLKLIAVLALAYGSLMLLKRTGFGTGGLGKNSGAASSGLRVVASLTLAPNRSVHVLEVPGGRTLVVGATASQVNLIADLGELPEDATASRDSSFFNVLKSKIAP